MDDWGLVTLVPARQSMAVARPRSQAVRAVRPYPMPRQVAAPRAMRRGSLWLFACGLASGTALAALVVLQLNDPSPLPSSPPPVTSPSPTTEAAASDGAVQDLITKATTVIDQPESRPAEPRPAEPRPVEPRVATTASQTAGAAERRAATAAFYGSLAIESTPPGARAYVNGASVGLTPLVLSKIPVGSRAIRVEADGHVAWSSAVRVIADRQTHVTVTLSRSTDQ